MSDGQLDECDLTIADLAKVKASFAKTLLGMMHNRIKYTKEASASTPPLVGADEPKEVTREFAVMQAMADAELAPVPISGAAKRRVSKKPAPPASAA